VVKPSEVAANTAAVMGRLLEKYMDKTTLAVIQGGVDETTELLRHKFDKILYTGNGFVGRIVMRAAAEHLTPVILELGGKSPLIIGPDVNMERAVARICWGKFLNCGQTCIAPDYVFVHHTRYNDFLEKMKAQIKDFYGSDPRKSTDYGKIINSRHAERITKLVDSSGGRVVTAGYDQVDIAAAYIPPTIVVDAKMDSKLMEDEIFGPVLPVFPMEDLDQTIHFINDRPKPLALYVFSQDQAFINKVLSETTSGGGCVNEILMHNMCKELPFGGVGESGMGAYNGKRSFDEFTHQKPMLVRKQNSDFAIRFTPFTPAKLAWLNRIDNVARFMSKNQRTLVVTLVVILSAICYKVLV